MRCGSPAPATRRTRPSSRSISCTLDTPPAQSRPDASSTSAVSRSTWTHQAGVPAVNGSDEVRRDVVVEAGHVIPGDGEIVEGVASIDESAITGESAPVVREAGGDRSGVTGGTRVLSDRIVIKITAGVSWVSCKDICIPGRTELTLDLPVSKTSGSANTGLFSEWRSRLPVNLTGGAPPFKADLKTQAEDDEYSVVVSLDWKEDLKDVALYPVPGNSYVVEDISVDTDEENGRSVISFEVKELHSNDSRQRALDTLIVYTGRDGKKSGYELEVPLHK